MKKIFAIVALLSLSLLTTTSFAQMAIDKGTKFVNLGIGIGGAGYLGTSALGFNAAADFGVTKNITVGAQAGYRSYGSSFGYSLSAFDIGARGSYHFNELLNTPENVDLYAGLGLTYFGYTGDGFVGDASFIYVPIHIGGRYMFSDKVGGFAELGSAVSTLRLGVTFKLGQ
ncbi:hypothetical protein [Fibrella aestuarina]|uniref:hypothetical protein n=1 Tax=Fibrella aestuarina TaxID=651143 RepID=UPI00059B7B46|nr:hypothetical protein [Fibrella aestuarina]